MSFMKEEIAQRKKELKDVTNWDNMIGVGEHIAALDEIVRLQVANTKLTTLISDYQMDADERLKKVMQLQSENRRLREALELTQWCVQVETSDAKFCVCPICSAHEKSGHSQSCVIGDALKGGEG